MSKKLRWDFLTFTIYPMHTFIWKFSNNLVDINIHSEKVYGNWIGTGSDHEDQNQQKPRSSYLVVTHQIDNLPNSQHTEESKSECLRSSYIFTIQYNHGVIIDIVIIKCDQSMIKMWSKYDQKISHIPISYCMRW